MTILKKQIIYLFLIYVIPSFALENCITWHSEINTTDLIIGQIDLNVGNIFDLEKAGENRKFHSFANKWHIKTKDHIIARELLFKVGDIFDQRLLDETERFIRGKAFIKAVEIYPTQLCGNKVTIQVDSNDNWTLTPGISYGRTGGKTKWAFELQEKNLFGLGKSLEFKYRKGLDRTQKSIKYNDDNLFGTRNRLDVIYENNSDGKLKFVEYYRPFFSLDTKYSWDVKYLDNQLINPLYHRGDVVDEIGQDRQFYTLSYGKLFNRSKDSVHRLRLGYTSDKNSFFHGLLFPNTPIPNSREYKYPWLRYEYFKEDYIKRQNFNTMGRTEDISLGHHFTGLIGQDFSASSQHFFFNYDKGLYSDERNFLLLKSYFNGINQSSSLLNSHLGAELNWFVFQNQNKTFYSSITFDKADNLFPENRQYLGGDTGLRGYPLRYLDGENKFLITLEQRYFYDWYPLKTFQFGAVLFVDSGAAWNNQLSQNHVTDIGFGIRLVPTRTSSGKVLHLDIAMPLDDREIVGNWQIQLRTKQSF